MTEFFLNLFIKNYKDSEQYEQRSAIGKFCGSVGIGCNVFLFLAKLVAGIITSSLSITADSLNNLSDAASSVITLLGFKMAKKGADKDHPYGHGRYEYLSGLIVAVMILFIGFELVKTSVSKIIKPLSVHFSSVAIFALVLSVIIKIILAILYSSCAKKINSTVLYASSVDSRNDVIISSAVLAGLITEHLFHINADGYIGLIVALFILYSGFNIAKETISPLLGQRADRELVEGIEQLILSHDKILGVHDLLIHDYGPNQCFASVHAELSADEDPIVCHDIIDHIENDALKELNIHLVIHYDPIPQHDENYNNIYSFIKETLYDIHPELSLHDLRIKDSFIYFDILVPYSADIHKEDIKAKTDKSLKNKYPSYVPIINFDGEF